MTDPEEIIEAIPRVHDGETVVDPELVARLLGRRRDSSPLESLTEREREVLAAMAEGSTNQGVAGRSSVCASQLSWGSVNRAVTGECCSDHT